MNEHNSDPVIVYFGTDWVGANRTSSHHVARWLGSRYRMLYFECPGLRAPGASGGDAGRLWQKLRLGLSGARTVTPNVTVRTLLQLPVHRWRMARWLNARLLSIQVRWGLARWEYAHRHPRVSWFAVPHVASLAKRINEEVCVYYCVDDYAAFPGVDSTSLRSMDHHLTRSADVVFVTSETLLPSKQGHTASVHHAPHGVDVEHFQQATRRLAEPPSDLPRGRPVIGYFGLVAEWIDLRLIDRLAVRHPEWQFVFLGRVVVPRDQLPVRDNIAFLGTKPYELLPAYGAWFDVAIIPYHLTEQVLHANPIKLREYIAMEKPIVAADTPNIRKLLPLVAVAGDDAEWEDAILAALHEPTPDERARYQRQAASAMSWEDRVSEVDRIVRRAIEARRG